MDSVFSSRGLLVRLGTDGAVSWSGLYQDTPVKQAIPVDGGERCILLLDPDASRDQTFENLICVDRSGDCVWTAKLPAQPDAFLEVMSNDEGVWAQTWSGWRMLLDRKTGAELRRSFAK
jgi:hypothetical protein